MEKLTKIKRDDLRFYTVHGGYNLFIPPGLFSAYFRNITCACFSNRFTRNTHEFYRNFVNDIFKVKWKF